MTFNEITQDVDFLCGSTSATYSTSNKTRNINIAYHDVARQIWDSAGDWQYDDSNATTLPISQTTLSHNQQDYSIPTTAQRIHRVEVKDNGGDWHKLQQLDLHDIDIGREELYKSPSLPIYYDIVGRSIMLYPSPSSAYTTLASGLAVYVDRNVTEFPTTATTTEPGFATPFHRILSYAAALDFVHDPNQRQFLQRQKDKLEQGLSRFYSKRNI
jgi:hypothetical protein